MNVFWIIYFAIVGLVLGSFFNVVGLRVPLKESIVYPSSHCPDCKHKLKWFELIPVFSYIGLKGKCRSCKSRISVLYPTIEAVTGCLFALAYVKLGWNINLLIGLLLVSMIVIITISDLVYMLIPDIILLIFTVIFVALRIFYPMNPWWDSYAGAGLGFLLLFLIAVLSRGAMGGGDIKLFFVLGLVLGIKGSILTFMIASFLGAFFGIIMMVLGYYKKRKPIPFGPFIGVGAIISFMYTNTIISWYINFFWK
jgi:leader peptidase (prepilin peptidase) / N-methyltransferase